MDTALLIEAAKVASTFTTAALGVAAVLFDYYDDEERLTRWGYCVLFGIGLSATTGILATVFEAQKSKAESFAQLTRNEAILKELERTIQPIAELQLRYWLEIPPGIPAVNSYIKRVSEGVEARKTLLSTALLPKTKSDSPLTKGLDAWSVEADGQILEIEITKDSDLWPHMDGAEATILGAMMSPTLSLFILKNPVDTTTYQPVLGGGRADFDAVDLLPKRADLNWDLKRRRLSLVEDEEFDRRFWHANGKVTSVVDLMGAQLLLVPNGAGEIPFPELDSVAYRAQAEVRRSFKFRNLMVEVGQGRKLQIPVSKIAKSTLKNGDPVFVVNFPSKESDFNAFFEEEDSDDSE